SFNPQSIYRSGHAPDSRCCVNLFGIGDALAYGRFMQQSRLELKDSSLLDTMRNQWKEEKEESERRLEKNKKFLETRETLEAEIKKIADEFELHAPYMPSSDEIIVFKRGLSAEIAPEIPLPLQEKINIWKKLVESREQEINNQKPFKIFGNEETIIYRNYYNGCNPSVKQFTKNLFEGQQLASLRSENKDPELLFDEYKVKVTLTIPMRKTENGWRVISDN
ncbi:hypothetical protein, partial [Comamonas thiooxydans]